MKKLISVLIVLLVSFAIFAEESGTASRIRVVKVPTNAEETSTKSTSISLDAKSADVVQSSPISVEKVKIEEGIEDIIVRTNANNVAVSKEEERKNAPVKLYWSLGLDVFLPVKNEWKDNKQKAISLGPDATIGMLIKDMAYLSFAAIPTFVQYKERIPNGESFDIKYAKMQYESTNLEVNLGVDFPWGDIDTLIGFAAGVDADTFKNFYIMPNARFGYKVLGALKPVLDTVNVTVGGKYTIPSKEWEIKIGVTFSGIY